MSSLYPREDIMNALFARVSIPEFRTKSRQLKLWGDVGEKERPALFMHELDEEQSDGTFGPPAKVLLHVELFIYTWAKASTLPSSRKDVVPATLLNNLVDLVSAALQPDNVLTGKQTLGGLVEQCWISGKVFKDPGDLDGDGLAVIPVSVMVPAFSYPVFSS